MRNKTGKTRVHCIDLEVVFPTIQRKQKPTHLIPEAEPSKKLKGTAETKIAHEPNWPETELNQNHTADSVLIANVVDDPARIATDQRTEI